MKARRHVRWRSRLSAVVFRRTLLMRACVVCAAEMSLPVRRFSAEAFSRYPIARACHRPRKRGFGRDDKPVAPATVHRSARDGLPVDVTRRAAHACERLISARLGVAADSLSCLDEYVAAIAYCPP